MKTLDTAFVRQQFPAFSEPSLKDWAHFENAGGSYACQQVIDRLTTYYTRTKVQPYHAHPVAQEAGLALDHSYQRFAEYLNVSEDEVHFGPSTSQNTYVLAQAFKGYLQAGDEIIVTNQDHEANSGAWRKLANMGVTVHEWCVEADTGVLELEQLDGLLNEKTKLLAYPQCSNIVGHLNPVLEINRMAHRVGAICVVDGVAGAPHGLPDVIELGADIYLASLYKTWGPHLGLMTIKRTLLDQLSNQGHFFHEDQPQKKLLPAGPDHAQIAAASGVIDYLDAVYAHHFEETKDIQAKRKAVNGLFKNHESELLSQLLECLNKRDDVRIVGPTNSENRAPTVSIWPLQKSISEVQSILAANKLMVGTAHFYAPRLLNAMKLSPDAGVLRMSFLHYTTADEINRLIQGLTLALD
ncbi:MAG: aminotransferase class V-fold PLP-dependent enzyme [Candidatus Marinimicrobia bacterium]|nr:aminotransferase class V-fold PLP-dependent enzyme [Candidatus Neomarinimicrobiota bacterium]MCF7851578.1 aminotransferase class V-fold PLP-dependent enzyme [Candidatus Neomarinimicrobiota bacterium]